MRDPHPQKKYPNNISVGNNLPNSTDRAGQPNPQASAEGEAMEVYGEGENAVFLTHHHKLGGDVVVYYDPTGPNAIDRVKAKWQWTKKR